MEEKDILKINHQNNKNINFDSAFNNEIIDIQNKIAVQDLVKADIKDAPLSENSSEKFQERRNESS